MKENVRSWHYNLNLAHHFFSFGLVWFCCSSSFFFFFFFFFFLFLYVCLFFDCFKMARVRINTRSRTKEKLNVEKMQILQNWGGKKKKSIGRAKYIYMYKMRYVLKECLFLFPWWLKKRKNLVKKIAPFFQMNAILLFEEIFTTFFSEGK